MGDGRACVFAARYTQVCDFLSPFLPCHPCPFPLAARMSLPTISAVTVCMLFMDLLWLSLRANYHDHLIKHVQGSAPELRVAPAIMVRPCITSPPHNATLHAIPSLRRESVSFALQVYLLMPVSVWHFAVRGSKTIRDAATQVRAPSHHRNATALALAFSSLPTCPSESPPLRREQHWASRCTACTTSRTSQLSRGGRLRWRLSTLCGVVLYVRRQRLLACTLHGDSPSATRER